MTMKGFKASIILAFLCSLAIIALASGRNEVSKTSLRGYNQEGGEKSVAAQENKVLHVKEENRILKVSEVMSI